MDMKKLAIVGATGLVGLEVLKCLKEQKLLKEMEIYLFVSDKSAGKILVFDDDHYSLFSLEDKIFQIKFDYAIFAVDETISKIWVKKFADTGTIVIDNSSAFRLDENVPLVVPEINFETILHDCKIIANPNCSTIQLVLVLDLLQRITPIKKIVVSSYQSVSGAGKKALDDLNHNTNYCCDKGFKDNIIAKIGDIDSFGNCAEENKIIKESKKILDKDFEIYATTVRVPISYCHGESVYVEFESDINLMDIKKCLQKDYIVLGEGIFFPTECAGSNKTFVFRLRKVDKNKISFFVIADNLRRGAAYNAVYILKKITECKN